MVYNCLCVNNVINTQISACIRLINTVTKWLNVHELEMPCRILMTYYIMQAFLTRVAVPQGPIVPGHNHAASSFLRNTWFCRTSLTGSVIFNSEWTRNCLLTSLHQHVLGELTTLSQLLSWIWGGTPAIGRDTKEKLVEGKEKKRNEGGKGMRYYTGSSFFQLQALPRSRRGYRECTRVSQHEIVDVLERAGRYTALLLTVVLPVCHTFPHDRAMFLVLWGQIS